jgi:hypothetical protein
MSGTRRRNKVPSRHPSRDRTGQKQSGSARQIERVSRLQAGVKAPVRAQKGAEVVRWRVGQWIPPNAPRARKPEEPLHQRTVPGNQIDCSSGIFIKRGHSGQKRGQHAESFKRQGRVRFVAPYLFVTVGPSGNSIRWSGMVKRREVRATFGL